MKKQLNYNYAFLFYDVGEKRVQKIFISFPKISFQRGHDAIKIHTIEK